MSEITLEQLDKGKECLKNDISKLVSDFYQKYEVGVSGRFFITEESIESEDHSEVIKQTTINTYITISL